MKTNCEALAVSKTHSHKNTKHYDEKFQSFNPNSPRVWRW